MRDLLDKLSTLENIQESNTPEIGDEFGISFSPDFEISTHVVEVLEDGIVVELDDTALEMLTNEGVRFFEGELVEGVAGPKSCWKGYRKTGTQPGTGKNAGKRVNDCEKIKEDKMDEGAKWRDPEYKDKLYRQNDRGEKVPMGDKNTLADLISGRGDQLRYRTSNTDGRYGDITVASKGKRKGMLTKNTIADLKGDIERSKGKHHEPNLPEEDQLEAKYQGREVQLGKKMAGDVKKSKVYVKNPQGNVVKVNFGDKKMRIKKSNPARRKSFRARHNCANPGPRHKARYWSCRSW